MKQSALITAGFALIVLIGGSIGYLKAGSVPSLIASSIFGTIFLLSALALMKGKGWGGIVALIASVVLAMFFLVRFIGNPAPMSGIMIILSTVYAAFMFNARAKLCRTKHSGK